MHNDILNWKDKVPMLAARGSVTVWTLFIEKLIEQASNDAKIETVKKVKKEFLPPVVIKNVWWKDAANGARQYVQKKLNKYLKELNK